MFKIVSVEVDKGREVAELINSQMNAGNYNLMWNAATKASGIYFYRLTADNFTNTKKMTLLYGLMVLR